MAPDITTVSIDIRVPPIFITDPAVLDNFPELGYSEPGCLATFYHSRSSRGSPKPIAISKQENISSPENLNGFISLLPIVTNTEVVSENTFIESPVSHGGEADDLFDSEYVLPDKCQWWEQVEDLSFEAPPGDFVDLSHFGDNLNYSGLWEDVDNYVSVVDVTDDDVTDECPLYEPVYCLDTRKTTVWGLDIIWEEDECISEMLD